MRFPIRVKNFSNPESFEKSLEQNAAGMKPVLFAKLVIDGEGIFQVEGPSPEDVSRNCRKIIEDCGAGASMVHPIFVCEGSPTGKKVARISFNGTVNPL
jgi:hypothetical protein